MSDVVSARPVQAGVTSAASFAGGAVLPLVTLMVLASGDEASSLSSEVQRTTSGSSLALSFALLDIRMRSSRLFLAASIAARPLVADTTRAL